MGSSFFFSFLFFSCVFVRLAVITPLGIVSLFFITIRVPYQLSAQFLFALFKQRYLELLESGEQQKAYEVLSQRLRPLEALQASPHLFPS